MLVHFLLLGKNSGIQNLQKTSQTEDSNTVFRGMEVLFPAEFQIIPYYYRFPTAPAKNACVQLVFRAVTCDLVSLS